MVIPVSGSVDELVLPGVALGGGQIFVSIPLVVGEQLRVTLIVALSLGSARYCRIIYLVY